jgi:hypothetical protein
MRVTLLDIERAVTGKTPYPVQLEPTEASLEDVFLAVVSRTENQLSCRDKAPTSA